MPSNGMSSPARPALQTANDKQNSSTGKGSWFRSARQKLTLKSRSSSQRLGLLEASDKPPESTSSPKPSLAFWSTGGRHAAVRMVQARSSTGSRRGEIPSFNAAPVPDTKSEVDIAVDDEAAQDELSPRTSVSSVFGSIRRSIGRVSSQKHSRISADAIREQEGSEGETKPTSPIPIPKPRNAPMLSLDLLGPGFSPNFDLTSTQHEFEETRKLTDPDNITLGVPITSVFPSAIQVATARESCSRPTRISIDDVSPRLPPPGPSTPMPGTNAQMDMDGNSSTGIPVFERGVETFDGSPGHKTLRPVSSIDAMTSSQEGDQLKTSVPDQKLETLRLLPPLTEASRVSSLCTISTIPSDMKPLTREVTPESRQEHDHGDMQKWQNAMRREADCEAPSTPLITPLGADDSEVDGLDFPLAALDHFDLSRAPSPDKSLQLAIRPRADSTRGEDGPGSSWGRIISPSEMGLEGDDQELTPSPPENIRVMINRTQSPESTHSSEPILRKDYDEFKTRHLFGDNGAEPDPPRYEEAADQTSRRDSSSPLFWPTELPPSVFDDSDSSISAAASMNLFDSTDSPKHEQHSSSPRNHINTSAVGLIKSYWGTLDSRSWLSDSRKSVSDDEAAAIDPIMHDTTPTSATPGPSTRMTYASSDSSDNLDANDLMGGRGKFERTRAERNARYNSLSQYELLKQQTSSPFDSSPPKAYTPGQKEDDDVFEDTPAKSVHTNFIRFGSSSPMKGDEDKENTPTAVCARDGGDKIDIGNASTAISDELTLCQVLGLPETSGDDWPLRPQGLEVPEGRRGELDEKVELLQELRRQKGFSDMSLEDVAQLQGLVRGRGGRLAPRK
ncbi:hypothetical protein EJ03DRAFT_17909 [Teratosphaeria nubilosa]|uniref:Uncharacterized protein n=1 Tax=Teratosphaeria nubilosa TaxID=161662 RepID=A0A6G1KW81_9PEZI|nr:hypothetical protein EJ03DRAFT_17909 [Teratosphaeria nubilosa]